MNLYDEFFAIIETLEANDITYTIIGGIALAFHDQPRFTKYIDILIKETQLERSEKALENINFFKSTGPHHFLNTDLILHRFVKTESNDYLIVDFLVGQGRKIISILKNANKANWDKDKFTLPQKKPYLAKIDIKNLTSDEGEKKN